MIQEKYKVEKCSRVKRKHVHMPSILAMDWQVARQLEIRVLDIVMQVGFTEGFVLEHQCFKISEISPKTSCIGVVDSKVVVFFDIEVIKLSSIN